MRIVTILITSVLLLVMSAGCDEGTGNPFAGSQWDVGIHHVSFSHAVADWNTTENNLELKFDLLSGATYPDAVVLIDTVTTLAVNTPRECPITIIISQDLQFYCDPSDPDATAEITFTRLDLSPLGAVSGTITGWAKNSDDPGEPAVAISASFENIPVVN